MPNRAEGECGLYTGSSRMGKTFQLQKKIKSHKRVIVWSVKETIDKYGKLWPDTIYLSNRHDLRNTIRSKGKNKKLRIVYMPKSMKEFGAWAQAAHALGIVAPCSVIGEELADVTSAGKAPDGWGNLLRQGLGWGINIYALSQRPAESDKTILGNLTYIHTHRMARADDRKYIAKEMDIDPDQIKDLEKYQWIEAWPGGQIKQG